jgi:hypothetical protein
MHLPEWGAPASQTMVQCVTHLTNQYWKVHKSFLNVDGTLGPITGIVLNKETKPLGPLQAQVSDQLRKRRFLW